jgi:thiopurine S-methyltransferase
LEFNFWLERWQAGQIGFHQAAVEPKLAQYFPALKAPSGSAVFVPLCGKSQDLLWLARRGHNVIGVELSSIAVEAFWLENGLPARRERAGRFDSFVSAPLRILQGDLFALDRNLLGPVAIIYDRASLIAWPHEHRQRYAAHLTDITQPGTKTLLVTLDYPQQETHGPPFSVPEDEVRSLYGKDHRIEVLSRENILASDARMRARGVTQLHQACYLMERL